jgi:hypothetical protein
MNALLPSPALAVVTAQGEACLAEEVNPAVKAEPSTLRDLSNNQTLNPGRRTP